MFHYVNHAPAIIMCFAGVKMPADEHMNIEPPVSPAIISGVLIVAIAMSV
ncbi:MAG: hypothetical protein LLG37_05505 [Spirochaetia bacterium]|nr:hypothetical protein [Spirochaetia bacterium]